MAISERGVTFEHLLRWSKDDSYLLPREVLRAVEQLVAQQGVQIRLMAMAMMRRRMAMLEKTAEQISEVETVLFQRFRDHDLKTEHLIRIWQTLRQDDSRGASMFAQQLQPGKGLEPDPDKLLEALTGRVPQAVELEDDVTVKVVEAITKLADRVGQQQRGMVTEPPIVC